MLYRISLLSKKNVKYFQILPLNILVAQEETMDQFSILGLRITNYSSVDTTWHLSRNSCSAREYNITRCTSTLFLPISLIMLKRSQDNLHYFSLLIYTLRDYIQQQATCPHKPDSNLPNNPRNTTQKKQAIMQRNWKEGSQDSSNRPFAREQDTPEANLLQIPIGQVVCNDTWDWICNWFRGL